MKDIQELENLMEQLVKLGEDRAELELWKKIFPALDDEGKAEILKNLKEEIEALK